MISRTSTPDTSHRSEDPPSFSSQAPAWQKQLANAVKSIDELLLEVELSHHDLGLSEYAQQELPLRVPKSFVARMQPGDPYDPLLLQVLPTQLEEETAPGYSTDPLGEGRVTPTPGLLHKYRGRALLVATGSCAIHCRYCFRRHFPYSEHQIPGFSDALDYLQKNTEIEEIILSGGDPLAMSDRRLADLVGQLEMIPHLRRLRIHTRLPVVLPDRVDRHLLSWLTGGRLEPIVVLHSNHSQEINAEVTTALGRLKGAGVTLLNQSVLLRGINNSVPALRDLSKNLFAAGVLPYYLHLVDRVRGATHFDVHEDEARSLVWELMRDLPGYLVPKLVREVPGAPAKMPIDLRCGASSPSIS